MTRMKSRFQYRIPLKNMKILATEECTDVYTMEPNIRALDMRLIMPPHSQNVSEHTEDEMKINYTETNIQNQSNVIGGKTNNQDVQTVNVPSPFETVLFWQEEKP
ncbi:hypothetical protein HHI36_009992 [Cryptolaemus montrouzieri]|uniref:Uncharacterized protein n=1 Tax=Cryptolaemus montrouzieri TaxID=559131 RepID=A0ABD2MHG2_9CUCU